MKIGLFLALLVLLASTNVFGQKNTGTKGRPHDIETGSHENHQEDDTVVKTDKVAVDKDDESEPSRTRVEVESEDGPKKTITVESERKRPTGTGKGRVPVTGDKKSSIYNNHT
jgi:hypothetical protein